MDFKSSNQPGCMVRWKGFVEGSNAVCVQIVTNQDHLFRVRVTLLYELAHLFGPIILRFYGRIHRTRDSIESTVTDL